MNHLTIKKIQSLTGRVCSIVTTSMNRAFDEQIAREHFVTRIQEVTQDGIWGTHPYNDDMISFYAMDHIVSVHTEVELNPDDPEHAAMIKEYEKKTGKKVKPDIGPKVGISPRGVGEGAKKSAELTVLSKPPVPTVDETTDTGDSTFIDIENLERLAEQSRRTFEAYDNHSLRKH